MKKFCKKSNCHAVISTPLKDEKTKDNVKEVKLVYKPGSVIDGHSSTHIVTNML